MRSKKTGWMIYGANGYSGRLIAQEAARLGLKPILAGRGAAVEQVGQQTGLPVRRFDLLDAHPKLPDRPGLHGLRYLERGEVGAEGAREE